MKKTLFIPALILLITGVSCQVLEDPSGKDTLDLKEIVLTGSVGDFTKVTEAGFSNGDVAGLSIGQPVGASNVPITYAAGSFTPSYTLYWAQGQSSTTKADFVAAYPYLQEANLLDGFSFTVKSDQSAEGAVEASDLLTAFTQASPSDESVNLSFGHALSRIVFDIDASATGDGIVSLVLEGVKTQAKVSIKDGRTVAEGEPSSVKAGMDGNYLVAVVAPQEVSPAVVITTTRGKQLRYVPDQALNLVKGKQLVAKIVIENNAVVSFLTDITPWTTQEVVIGPSHSGETGEHSWKIYRSGDNGPYYVEMEPQEDGTYTAVMEGFPYFCLIRDNEQYFGSVMNTNLYNYDLPGFYEDEVYELPLILIDEIDLVQDVSHVAKVVNRSTARGALVTLDPNKYILYFQVLPHQWEPLGKGKFIDGIIDGRIMDYPDEEWEVDIEEDAAYPGTYRIVDPYKNAGWIADNRDFTLEEGGEIIFNIDEKHVWLSDAYTGLSYMNRYRVFASSLVHDIWWWVGDEYLSGHYDQANQFISFQGYTAFHYGAYGTDEFVGGIYATNRNNMLSITLPGGTRPVKYDTLEDLSVFVNEDQIEVSFFAGMDVESVEYAVIAGIVSAEDAAATAQFTALSGFKPGTENTVKLPKDNMLSFTVVLKAISGGESKLFSVQNNEAYNRWIGVWNEGGFEIEAFEEGVSVLLREGYLGDSPIEMILDFDTATGNLLYKYQELPINEYEKYVFVASGITEEGVLCTDPSVTIATFEWKGDNMAEVVGGTYRESPFTSFGIYAFSSTDYSYMGYVMQADLPMKVTKSEYTK
ncbi:MAG: fimbrillin family protein [Bacteroidales bacterium]|nr:fimbrillin family protein [Bacteroidales bacterium]